MEIKKELQNGVITFNLSGRVDASNATDVEAQIFENPEELSSNDVVLDIEDLEYISSAGLRIILKIKKGAKSFKIINACSEVYDIFDMTGFAEMLDIEKAFRKFSVDGCEVIGKGAKGTVYRYNADTIIKVYNDNDSLPLIQRERALARKAFVLGIPTAISYDVVKVDGKYGSVFELLDAKPYSVLIRDNPEEIEKYVKEYADLSKQIHSTKVSKEDMPNIKILVNKWIEECKPFLPAEDIEKISKLVADCPDRETMIHCDYHTNNVMLQNGETLLIDMDTLSYGHPIFELANVYITYVGFLEFDAKNVEDFLGFASKYSEKVWEIYLPEYLGTTDEAVLKDVEDKAKLLSYCRIIRHFKKRCTPEDHAKIVAVAKDKIHELLQTINTLEF